MSNTTIHPDAPRLAAYRSGRLPAAEALGISDHLAGCAACCSALPASAAAVDLPTVPPDAPPGYEEMAALLDGTLDAAQTAEVRARLAASPEGAAAFAGLQRFRDDLAALPPKWHGPTPPSGAADAPAAERPPGTRRVVPFPLRGRAAWFAAAAVLAIFAAGWWMSTRAPSVKTPPLWADADLSRLPDDLRRSVERAARTGTVDVPPLPAELNLLPGTLAGSPPEPTTLRPISPVGVVVREDRPALQWTAVEDATGYVVYLSAVEERTPALRQEVSGGTTTWTPPESLARGATFEWQVEALRGGKVLARAPRPPAPEARFRVLDAPRAAELTEVERLYPQNALILGTAYARAGLGRAAGQQFGALARRYPESGAARRLQQGTAGQ